MGKKKMNFNQKRVSRSYQNNTPRSTGLELEIFKCKSCGNCCKNLRGRFGKYKPPSLPLNFTYFQDYSKMTLIIHEWTIPTLQEEAKKLNINLKIEPNLLYWDDLTQTPIALNWQIDHDNCPFLSSSNHCLIYDLRPLVCQSFPIQAYNLVEPKEYLQLFIDNGDCPNRAALPFPKGRFLMLPIQIFTEIYKRYGENLLAMLRLDLVGRISPKYFSKLTAEWKVIPAIIDEEIKLKLKNIPAKGFFEFLKEKYPDDYKKAIQEIQRVNSLTYEDLRGLL